MGGVSHIPIGINCMFLLVCLFLVSTGHLLLWVINSFMGYFIQSQKLINFSFFYKYFNYIYAEKIK